jgi:hypothetical protein
MAVNRDLVNFYLLAWFKDANTLYIADDGSAASGGGIQKWTQSGGTWSLAYGEEAIIRRSRRITR